MSSVEINSTLLTYTQLTLPQYVLDYAPLVYLHTDETYFPSDWATHLQHTIPQINFATVNTTSSLLTLDNLDSLNLPSGTLTYLTSSRSSTDDVITNPAWLNGVKPDANGRTIDAVSAAIMTVNKGNDTLDAFYMYFYAYNSGNLVFGNTLGNHVGDVEHNMIRFVNGTPTAMWYSQHSFGGAFKFSVIPTIGLRPIVYSSKGTHANWVTAGSHQHLIPNIRLTVGFAPDYTSAGALWDPTLSAYYYHVDFPSNAPANSTNGTIIPYSQPAGTSSYSPAYCSTFNNYSTFNNGGDPSGSCAGNNHVPTSFLHFRGHWGDDQYPKNDPRQKDFLFGLAFKCIRGPKGPLSKWLNRKDICPKSDRRRCILRTVIEPGD